MERPIYFPEAEENIRKAKEAAEAAKQREKAHKEALKENKARDKAKQDKYAEDYKAAVKENKARDKAKEDKYSEDDFQRLFIKEKTEDSADTTGTDKPTETPNTTEQTEPVVEPVVDTTTEAIPNKPIENTPSTTSKKDEDSTYEYDPMNPIFGKKGFHVGDKAERLPAELEEDEKEKARDEKQKEREEQQNHIKDGFISLFGKKPKDKTEQTPVIPIATEPVTPAATAIDTTKVSGTTAPVENTPSTTSKKDEDSTYEYDPMNPIFGKKGFHVGDKAERLPAELEEKDRRERERQEQQSHVQDGLVSLFGRGGYHPEQAPTASTGASIEQEPALNLNSPEAAKQIENSVNQTLSAVSGPELSARIIEANSRITPEQARTIANNLEQPEVKRSLAQRIKDKLGALTGGAIAGFAANMLSRSLVRNGIRFLLGGSFGAGILAGAGAGGAIEGVKTWHKERNKFSANEITAKLDAVRTDVERAVIISQAQKALAEARINDKSRVPELKAQIQKAQATLEARIKAPEYANKSEKDKIAFILNLADKERTALNKEQKKEVKALMTELKLKTEKSKVDWNKVVKAAGKGALVGAVGGAIGGAIAGVVTDFMHPDLAHGAIQHHIEQLGGLKQQTYDSVLKQGSDKVLGANYTETAAHGEGLTHLARKGIHDLLTNAHKLNPTGTPNFTPEQLVYAEDYILKNDLLHQGVSSVLYPGDHITLSGAQIMDALTHAGGLNSVQLESLHNLLNTPGHLLSAHTREMMLNFDQFADRANDFADPLIAAARAAAEQVGPETLTWFESPSTDIAKKYLWYTLIGGGALAAGGAAMHRMRKNEEQPRVTPAPETPVVPNTPRPGSTPPTRTPGNAAPLPANPNITPGNTAPLPTDPNAPKNPSSPDGSPSTPQAAAPERVLTPQEQTEIKEMVDKIPLNPEKGTPAEKTEEFKKALGSIMEFWRKNLDDDKYKKLVEKLKGYKLDLIPKKMSNGTKSVATSRKDKDVLTISAFAPDANLDEITEQLTTTLGVLNDGEKATFKKALEAKKAAEVAAANTNEVEDFTSDKEPSSDIDNPKVLNAQPLSPEEAAKLSDTTNIVSKIEKTLNWSADINDAQKESFIQNDLTLLVDNLKSNHADLLPYLDQIKLTPYSDTQAGLSDSEKGIKANQTGSYDINIQKTYTDLETELIPLLESLRDADPNKVQAASVNTLNPSVNTLSPVDINISRDYPEFSKHLKTALDGAPELSDASKNAVTAKIDDIFGKYIAQSSDQDAAKQLLQIFDKGKVTIETEPAGNDTKSILLIKKDNLEDIKIILSESNPPIDDSSLINMINKLIIV